MNSFEALIESASLMVEEGRLMDALAIAEDATKMMRWRKEELDRQLSEWIYCNNQLDALMAYIKEEERR